MTQLLFMGRILVAAVGAVVLAVVLAGLAVFVVRLVWWDTASKDELFTPPTAATSGQPGTTSAENTGGSPDGSSGGTAGGNPSGEDSSGENPSGGNSSRDPNAAPPDVPPLDESALDEVMLSTDDLNGIVDSTGLEVISELDEMADHSSGVSDPDCLGAVYGAEEPVYAGSGWTAVRDQIAREPDEDSEHWVEQTAVLFPSADKAQTFFDRSTSNWQECAGFSISVDSGDTAYLWEIDGVTAKDSLITQVTTQVDADGWACQHALSVVSNLTIEAWACGDRIRDEAATIANQMVANAADQ
jgi:hypothetical protein